MTSNKKEKIEIPIMSDIIEVTISSGILYIYTYTYRSEFGCKKNFITSRIRSPLIFLDGIIISQMNLVTPQNSPLN